MKKGDLVEPTASIDASYSKYAGRPETKFLPGMLGVVRHIDKQLGGFQVEFFHPATGCMERAWTTQIKKVKWPEGLALPPDTKEKPGWWSCGSLDWRGSLALLQATAALRPDFFRDLHPETLRIPLIHASRLRQDLDQKPEGCDVHRAALDEAASSIAKLLEVQS